MAGKKPRLIVPYILLHFLLEHHDKLNDMIQQLTVSLGGVKHEQEYMEVRDRVHRASKNDNFYIIISRYNI